MSASPPAQLQLSRLTRVEAGAPPVFYGSCLRLGSWWLIEAEPHILLRFKRWFARVDPAERNQIRIRRSPEVDRDMQCVLDRFPLEMSDDDIHALHMGAEHHRKEARIVAAVLAGTYEPRRFEMAVPPREYQRIAADLWLATRGLLLADDLGLGKTCSAIMGLSDPATRPALVVCPTALTRQWKREINRFLPGMRVHILEGTTPYDVGKAFARDERRDGRDADPKAFPDVVVTNYHRIHGWADVLSPQIRGIVWDEVQELRHKKHGNQLSRRYAAAEVLVKNADYILGMSATPVYNYGGESHAIFDVIRPGVLGSKEEFVREHCVSGEEDRKTKVRDPRAFGLYLRDEGLMLMRTRKDVGRELPALTIVPHHIEADIKALDAIKGHAGQLARTILEQRVGKGAGLISLQASGEFERIMRQATGVAKAPFCAAFLRMAVESGKTVLAFAHHREVYRLLAELLDDFKPAFFTGAESEKQKAESFRRFTKGETPLFIAGLRTGSAGLDGLQHVCSTVAICELDWSPKIHEQGIGRVHRDQQTEPVFAYFLLADVGSDPVVSDVCGAKLAQSTPIRDPLAKVVAPATDPAHVRLLAEQYLATHRMGR